MYFPVFQILLYCLATSMPVFRLKGSMPMASRGSMGMDFDASETLISDLLWTGLPFTSPWTKVAKVLSYLPKGIKGAFIPFDTRLPESSWSF